MHRDSLKYKYKLVLEKKVSKRNLRGNEEKEELSTFMEATILGGKQRLWYISHSLPVLCQKGAVWIKQSKCANTQNFMSIVIAKVFYTALSGFAQNVKKPTFINCIIL